MRLKETLEEGIEVLVLAGEIDLHYAPVLRALLQAKIAARSPALILDLSGVTFIDSSGLAAIIEYFRDAADHGGVLCLAGMNDTLQTIFEIVRLDQVVPIFTSRSDAISALQRGTVRPPAHAIFDRSAA